MTINCVTLTYGRVDRLNECIESFLRQDYPDKRMLILNTFPKQKLQGSFPGVTIHNLETRPANLGAARNIAVAMCDEGLIVTLDDDDMALPHYLSTFARELEQNPEAQWLWLDKQFYLEGGKFLKLSMGMMNTFAYTRKAWETAGYYNQMNVGEDRDFVGRVTKNLSGTKVCLSSEDVGYLYCWGNGVYHVSGLGDDKPGHMNSWERSKRDLDQKIARREVPTGDIELKPAWKHDYAAAAKVFLASSKLSATAKSPVCIVRLGRYGDIINILPVAQHIANHYCKPAFMVSVQFADILDGVSYVLPHVIDVQQDDIHRAMKIAQREYPVVVCAQMHLSKDERITAAYNLESWRRAGFEHLFDEAILKPCFDKRDPAREEGIYRKLTSGAPMILTKLKFGISSPFDDSGVLANLIHERFGRDFQIVELSTVKSHRIYDLIGLMDRAAALVTIDTSTLHLAAASDVKVMALVNPKPWLGTIPRCNTFGVFDYDAAIRGPQQIVDAIAEAVKTPACLTHRNKPTIRTEKRRLFHAVERHKGPRDKRKEAAWQSWDLLYKSGVIPCHYWDYKRTALEIGDRRPLPFLKDVLSFAMPDASGDDIIFLTNDDNMLHPSLPSMLDYHISLHGPCSSQRCDFKGRVPPLNDPPAVFAKVGLEHMGRDLFAFKKSWLLQHWDEIPDFILGASDWDLCFAALLRLEYGIISDRKNIEMTIHPAELPRGYVLHRHHIGTWQQPNVINSAPSQKWNRKLFHDWAKKHLPELHFFKHNTI